MYILYPSQHAFNAEIIRPFVCTIPDLILKLYVFFLDKSYFPYSGYNGSMFHIILYPELPFLLRYTPSLSTPILQDFCKI